MLVLAVIWWAWAAYAWLTNEVDSDRRLVRLTIVAAMIAMLITSLAIPGAFEDDALLFALAYLGVRLAHIFLFGVRHGTRRRAQRRAGAGPDGHVRARAADRRQRAGRHRPDRGLGRRAGARLCRGRAARDRPLAPSPAHFAERHELIVIIALGESIVAIGIGAEGLELGIGELAGAALAVTLAAALWWTYFDPALPRVEAALHDAAPGRERNVMARDAFSFLHLPLVAGIVLLALGLKKSLEHVEHELKDVAAAALCGGVALYLVADVAFRARCLRSVETPRLVAAAACVAAIPLALELPALGALGVVAAIGAALVAYESAAGAQNTLRPLAQRSARR